MSAELCAVRDPGGDHGCVQSTTVSASKPLHRFLKGQPKTTGVVVLLLGASLFVCSVAVLADFDRIHIWTTIPPSLLLGAVLIASGILYIVTEHNPTKKTVTVSLALSILSVLCAGWSVLYAAPHFENYQYLTVIEPESDSNTTNTDSLWPLYHERVAMSLETVLTLYSFVGGIICVVMSALAGAALRPSTSQVIVTMTSAPSETPAGCPAPEETLQCEHEQ